ncbi:MAG: family 10 glycosylhydrolase, partial [Ignavibacteria bacterium]|nr:family 10 glycosylhydrolase [Ignavibacteria bacterium]
MINKIIILICLMFSLIYAQPKHEVRAVWIATNFRLDWPPKSYNAEVQKKALIEILDDLQQKHFNTIFFQVRSQGTVFYKSRYEPWSTYLAEGKEPEFDPLQFLLDEAHKRFFEVHAWLNMLLVKQGDEGWSDLDSNHILIKNPSWTRKYLDGNSVSYWLDPALPEVRDYLKNLCIEVVTNYKIDGIHFDFLRYPGRGFDDNESYLIYGQGKKVDDWRRENINKFVREVYDTLIAIKPMLKVGSAPIGIYQNIYGARGLEGRNDVYQDSRQWLKEGKQDYIAPQIYWGLSSNPRFDLVLMDWIKNNYDRQIIPGIAAYDEQILPRLNELISISRNYSSSGNALFRYSNIKNVNPYKTLAIIPSMKWKDNNPPNPPSMLTAVNLKDKLGLVQLNWLTPFPASDGDLPKFYILYRSIKPKIDRNDANFLSQFSFDNFAVDNLKSPEKLYYYYQVSSVDKGNNESLRSTEIVRVELTNLKSILTPLNNSFISYFHLKSIQDKYFLSVEMKRKGKLEILLVDKNYRVVEKIFDSIAKEGLNIFQLDRKKLEKFKG